MRPAEEWNADDPNGCDDRIEFIRAVQADALESAAEIAAITVFHVRNADGTIMTKAEAIRALKPEGT